MHLWGLAWRSDLVYRSGVELRQPREPSGWPGSLVLDRPGRDDDLGCWGVFVWKEFALAPSRAKTYLIWMFIFFLCGLTMVALAPIFR